MTTLHSVIAEALRPYVGNDPDWLNHVATQVTNFVVAFQGDESFELRARRDAPATSKITVDRIKQGSAQERVLQFFVATPIGGWTDDELEDATGRSHQSVSSVRNILMNKGYVRDSGETRKTRSGNPAIVYCYTGKEVTS